MLLLLLFLVGISINSTACAENQPLKVRNMSGFVGAIGMTGFCIAGACYAARGLVYKSSSNSADINADIAVCVTFGSVAMLGMYATYKGYKMGVENALIRAGYNRN